MVVTRSSSVPRYAEPEALPKPGCSDYKQDAILDGNSLSTTNLTFGGLIRAKRFADSRVLDDRGRQEPQIALEWCGQSVRHARELDQWAARVRESREQAQKTDARLAETLREARELKEEIRLEKDDLAKLRSQSEQATQERSNWESELEMSRSSVRKLEAKLLTLHRWCSGRPLVPGHPGIEAETVEARIPDLAKQRDRLATERDGLAHKVHEQEREVRTLAFALEATPSVPIMDAVGAAAASIFKSDLAVAEDEAQVARLQLETAELEVAGIRARNSVMSGEVVSARTANAGAVAHLAVLDAETGELHAAGRGLASEIAQARSGEASRRRDLLKLQEECQMVSQRLHQEEATQAQMFQEVTALQTSAVCARREAQTSETQGQAHAVELEAECSLLQNQLDAQQVAVQRAAQRHVAGTVTISELERHIEDLNLEVQASGAAAVQLEASAADKFGFVERIHAAVRHEQQEEQRMAAEVSASWQWEEQLRAELVEEQHRVQEGRAAAEKLTQQRRSISDEVNEALRRCNGAIAESQVSANALRERDEQLARSERSFHLMHTALAQRYSSLKDQIKEAEKGRLQAMGELQEERRLHEHLRMKLQGENSQRRARLQRPLR